MADTPRRGIKKPQGLAPGKMVQWQSGSKTGYGVIKDYHGAGYIVTSVTGKDTKILFSAAIPVVEAADIAKYEAAHAAAAPERERRAEFARKQALIEQGVDVFQGIIEVDGDTGSEAPSVAANTGETTVGGGSGPEVPTVGGSTGGDSVGGLAPSAPLSPLTPPPGSPPFQLQPPPEPVAAPAPTPATNTPEE